MNIINKSLQRILAVAFTVLLFISMGTACASAYSYTTNSYEVLIDVNENNTYDVTETIYVDFISPKHGIYRYIPDGNYYGMGYMSISKISVDGWNYETYQENDNEVIQIGDADKTIIGNAVYPISYNIKIYDDRDESKDFLYLDVIPTGWETPIKKATVTMKLPKAIDVENLEVYSGSYGTNSQGSLKWSYDEDSCTLTIDGANLPQGYGITVYCPLPEGYWQGEATFDWAKTLTNAINFVLPLIMIALWWFVGKDKKIVPTVEFYPPDGMTPAEVGYVIDNSADQRDLVSMLMYYADRGYLSIEQQDKKNFIITKIKDIDSEEKSFAKTLFNGFFKKGDEVNLKDLDEDFGDSYMTAKELLTGYFSNKKNRQITIASSVLQIVSVVVCLIAQILSLVFASLYFGEENIFLATSGLLIAIFTAILISLDRKRHVQKKAVKHISGVIFWILEILAIGIYCICLGSLLQSWIIALIVMAEWTIAYICIVYMQKRTENSVKLMGKILGLKNFIETAELDRINMLVEENPNYFYNILPYAYVMGLTDKWAKNFENIHMTKPSWYKTQGADIDLFDVWLFSSMMNSCGRSFAGNIHIPVNENVDGGRNGGGGFFGGGGGFSGGGFGGGGGGSW